MNKKFKSFLGMVSVTLGGGCVYASANRLFSVGADSLYSSSNSSAVPVVLFVVGILFIATGIMTAISVFAISKRTQ